MKPVQYSEIDQILKDNDKQLYLSEFPENDKHIDKLKAALGAYLNEDRYSIKSILGIDIYRYSKFVDPVQTLIPFIFKMLYIEALDMCFAYEKFLFPEESREEAEKSFIDTGDGGFQIFDTPIHSILFLIYFETVLRAFNSFSLRPRLRAICGEISLRYALTFDRIHQFDDNFYGAAIINSARILSKDSLNRFLIDYNTYLWFLRKIKGIESLSVINIEYLKKLQIFSSAPKNSITEILPKRNNAIKKVDILKIDTINAKGQSLDIYNVHMQVHLNLKKPLRPDIERSMMITIGNLNTTGLNV